MGQMIVGAGIMFLGVVLGSAITSAARKQG